MPFTVTQTDIWAGMPSVKILDAGATVVEVLVTTSGSTWLAGAAVTGPGAGVFLGQGETWFRFACEADDELWAFASRDVKVTVLTRSEAP